jgi:hypothetical protein
MFGQLGDLVAFGLLGLSPDSPSGAALQFFVMDVAKILVLLVADPSKFAETTDSSAGFSCAKPDIHMNEPKLRGRPAWNLPFGAHSPIATSRHRS